MWQYMIKSTPVSMKAGYDYKIKHSFEKRKDTSTRLLIKYPNLFPIILEKADNCELAKISKTKYLLASNLTIGEFLYIIRKQIRIS